MVIQTVRRRRAAWRGNAIPTHADWNSGHFLSGFSTSYAESDEKTAKELKLLEGVWADESPKGDGRGNVVRFNDGKMGWRSTRYRGGEPLIGTTEGFEVQIEASVKPKLITLTRGDDKHKVTLLGIYEIEGDTLKMALGLEKDRPKTLDDKDALLLTLKKVKPKEVNPKK